MTVILRISLAVVALLGIGISQLPAAPTSERPNILWISCEDTSPWLGFCGEKYAITPNLDRLAREGVYYRNAFASAPVCSPSRFAIITGLYAPALGTQRLRSKFPVPDSVVGFPSYLRKAGYYCVNNVKTDYNTSAERRIVREAWDDCSGKAHWRNRKPGQPFFAVFNLTETHQSKSFESNLGPDLEPSEKHDPAKAPVPPYFPNTPAARRTMARVHDCITAMDKHAGQILSELERDGLKENTIVFFWPDHGQGIPRGKRTLWDTGLQVPLIVYFPKKYRDFAPATPGQVCDRLVSLIDLGPTVLSLANLPLPQSIHGKAFLGKSAGNPRQYVYGARDRVDEALEVSRSVRDNRFLYIRNYMPDLSWLQPESYSDQLAFRRELAGMAKSNLLNAAQLTLAGPTKPIEALYDTTKDPWQLENLANNPENRETLLRMRKALTDWQVENRDLGMIHEWQADKMCAGGKPVCEAAAADKDYALERVMDTANRVGTPNQGKEFAKRLSDADPTVRYWAAIGLRAAGNDAADAKNELGKALQDTSLPVQIEAAAVLVRQWDDRAALDRLLTIAETGNEHAVLHAARTLEMLGEKTKSAQARMRALAPKCGELARRCLETAIQNASNEDKPLQIKHKKRRKR